MEDEWVWIVKGAKVYSVSSGYELLMDQASPASDNSGLSHIFRNFWQCIVPRKVLALSWQVLLDRLPTRINLLVRGVLSDPTQASCMLCGLGQESGEHLFTECFFSVRVWESVHRWLGFPLASPFNIVSIYLSHMSILEDKKAKTLGQLF